MRAMNPWWYGAHSTRFQFKRVAYYELRHWMIKPDWKMATLVAGPRRVGKTTVFSQLIEEYLANGWNPLDIVYLSLDHPLIKLRADEGSLDHILNLCRENTGGGRERLLLFLDEIQYYRDWPVWIKHTVDFRPEIRIAATGSAALELATGSGESGVGRWVTVRMPPMSFYEHLRLTGAQAPELDADLRVLKLPGTGKAERNAIVGMVSAIKDLLHDYLLRGGFPELARLQELAEVQRILREDVVDKVLKRDMTAAFGVRHVLEMEKLFIYICLHSGGVTDKSTLAKELGVSQPTVANYLEWLRSAGLVYMLAPIQNDGKLVLKGRPKVYVSNTAVRNAVLMKGQEIFANDTEMGLIIETAVFNHFQAFHYREMPRLGYWRGHKNQEVDLVLVFQKGGVIPVEVKYRSVADAKSEANLRAFLKVSEAKLGILVVRRAEEFDVVDAEGGKILKIPAFLLLYLLGHSEHAQW